MKIHLEIVVVHTYQVTIFDHIEIKLISSAENNLINVVDTAARFKFNSIYRERQQILFYFQSTTVQQFLQSIHKNRKSGKETMIGTFSAVIEVALTFPDEISQIFRCHRA